MELVYRSRALWECGKAEPSLRGFSKPLWEIRHQENGAKQPLADFHSGGISTGRPPFFFVFGYFFLFLNRTSFPCGKPAGSRYEQLPLLGQRLQETFERDQLGQW